MIGGIEDEKRILIGLILSSFFFGRLFRKFKEYQLTYEVLTSLIYCQWAKDYDEKVGNRDCYDKKRKLGSKKIISGKKNRQFSMGYNFCPQILDLH